MKDKILAIFLTDIEWQYYSKFKVFLEDLKHPFLENIDFVLDTQMILDESTIINYPVVAFFYRDPLKILYPIEYEYSKRIENICDKNNIRLINKPDALSNSVKSIQLNILKDNGFKVANFFVFNNLKELASIEKSNYPVFIRHNAGHDSHDSYMQGLFYSFKDIKLNYKRNLFEAKNHFKDKIAIQWIDTKYTDGFYRRFRAFVTGSDAIKGNLHVSNDWYIHGDNAIKNEITIKEQEDFMNIDFTNNEKELFIKANKTLGLDFGAYDYSYTKDGDIIIWEANPHPAFPKWTENEPFKSKITNLIVSQFSQILSEQLYRGTKRQHTT